MSAIGTNHPEHLLWYAGGRLAAEEAARVETHVASCAECEAEVTALQSMFRSIRDQARTDHIDAMDLIAWQEGEISPSDRKARLIGEHLGACRECSADLKRLRSADSAERTLREGRTPARWVVREAISGRRWLSYAAGALIVAGAAAWAIGSLGVPRSAAPAATPIIFAPPQRSAGAARRLEGRGPWEIEILLPINAPRAAYRTRVQRADGSSETILETILESGSGGGARLTLPDVPEPGHYLLTLEPAGGDATDTYLYGFDVVRGS